VILFSSLLFSTDPAISVNITFRRATSKVISYWNPETELTRTGPHDVTDFSSDSAQPPSGEGVARQSGMECPQQIGTGRSSEWYHPGSRCGIWSSPGLFESCSEG